MTDPVLTKNRNRKILLKVTNATFLIIVFVFLGFFLFKNSRTVGSILYNADPYLLGLSLLFHSLFVLFQGTLGVAVLRATGGDIPYVKALPILCLSLMGRYIPGKIWVVSSRISLFSMKGIKTAQIVTATIKEHIFTIFSGLLIAMVFLPAGIIGNQQAYLWGTLILAGFLLLPPSFVYTLINRGLSIFGKQPLESWATRRTVLAFLCLYCINWFVLGSGLILLAKSLYPAIPLTLILPWTGLYSLAVSAGFIAIFSPGGIGVREGIFFLGFSSQLPAVEAGALALMTRLIVTLAEVIVLLAVLSYDRVSRVLPESVPSQEETESGEYQRVGHD
ncbi:MAG: lysylphosphatidylglycerol synthase domain-containing protein [bacterium]|nr:lysylphosphatidylglycerol synthase domain-containing protein [bacterium]